MEENFPSRTNRLLKKKKKKKATASSTSDGLVSKTSCADYPSCKCCVDGEDIENCKKKVLQFIETKDPS